MKKRIPLFINILIILGLILGITYYPSAAALVPGNNKHITQSLAGGMPDDSSSTMPRKSLSRDGRYIVFTSSATNLVANDINNLPDVFVRDTLNGTTSIASIAANGIQSNGNSIAGAISDTGRYVLFYSWGSFSVGSPWPNTRLFMKDMVTGNLKIVMNSGSGYNLSANGISSDGRYVTFISAGAFGSYYSSKKQVYISDTTTGSVRILSADSSNTLSSTDNLDDDLNCSGNMAVFASKSPNLPGNNGITYNIFLADINWTGVTLKNITNSTSTNFYSPQISCDGNNILYADSSNNYNYYMYNRATNNSTLVTKNSAGQPVGTWGANMSGDGRYVVFITPIAGVVTGYSNTTPVYNEGDVYIRDTRSSTTQLVSFTTNGSLSKSAQNAVISPDGSNVAFYYKTPASGDSNHELINGVNTGTSTPLNGTIYKSETGF